MLTGTVFRVLASLSLAAGGLMVALFAVTGRPLILILSTVGLALGASMWKLALREPRDHRWWLEQHMNAATVNFAATHDSFISLAVGSASPILRQPWPRAATAVTVLVIAMALRIWFGRRYLRTRPRTNGAESTRPVT